MKETMAKVHKEYKEEPLKTEIKPLERFVEALKTKGFNLDPFKICKILDAEAERQFEATFSDIFKGQSIDVISKTKDEVIKWYNEEEARFEIFRENYIKNAQGPMPMDVGAAPVFEHDDAHAELPIATTGEVMHAMADALQDGVLTKDESKKILEMPKKKKAPVKK
jgi:hypothetical protein